jgi:hypothetical protein
LGSWLADVAGKAAVAAAREIRKTGDLSGLSG